MGLRGFGRLAFFVCIPIALVVGCAAPETLTATGPVRLQAAASWMARNARSQDLLYVSSGSDVVVYSFPKLEFEGTLGGFIEPWGLCSDEAGDVFITDPARDTIDEYAHGGTEPIWTLPLTKKGVGLIDCAVDPTTGNLAVTSSGALGLTPGNVTVYPGARGPGVIYTDPNLESYGYCDYDGKGNLFIDAVDNQDNFAIDELAHGGGTLTPLILNYMPGEWPAGIQWTGKYLAVGQQLRPTIFHYTISGNRATTTGNTVLSSSYYIHQFLVVGKQIIVPNRYYHGYAEETNLQFYHFPAGGEPFNTIVPNQGLAEGVALSKAP